MQSEYVATLRHGFLTFSSSCLKAVNKARFLKMTVEGNKITFTPAEAGIAFYRETEGQLVLRAGRDSVKAFESLSGQTFDKKLGTKFTGEAVDGSLVFTIE